MSSKWHSPAPLPGQEFSKGRAGDSHHLRSAPNISGAVP